MNDTNTLQLIATDRVPMTQSPTLEERIAKLEATIKALEDRIVDLEELDLINAALLRIHGLSLQNIYSRMDNPNP